MIEVLVHVGRRLPFLSVEIGSAPVAINSGTVQSVIFFEK